MSNTMTNSLQGNSSTAFGSTIDKFFHNGLRRVLDDNWAEPNTNTSFGGVPVNVRETDQQFELDIIAPGCNKKDFKIKINGNSLIVSLNDKEDDHSQSNVCSKTEFIQQSFKRTFIIDDCVDLYKINATYIDGVLQLILPKYAHSNKITRDIEVL